MKAASFPGSVRCPFCNALATRQEAIDRHVLRRHSRGVSYETPKTKAQNYASHSKA